MTMLAATPDLPSRSLRRSEVAKKAFFRIAELWELDDEQAAILLGQPRADELQEWKRGEGDLLPHDALERVSCVLGIYKALQLLFEPGRADAWINAPNDYFNGRSALDQMLAGKVADLYEVRRYLDYVRGGRS